MQLNNFVKLMRVSGLNWQKLLAQGFISAKDLLHFLNIPSLLNHSAAENQFKTRVPRGFAARMEKGNPNDPLLLQVLALNKELEVYPEYINDPLGEKLKNYEKGLIHKYKGRILLILTTACAVHCRYCFRRHFPYEENNPGRKGWEPILEYIRKDPSIHEVILSGGDPLLATSLVFKALLLELEAIPHLRTLRIHSRIPVVLPERIDDEFLNLMKSTRLRKVLVLHSNHSRELNEDVLKACQKLKAVDFHLLNQAVLLKDINDSLEALMELSERLLDCGVLPYYLHVLDKVAGAAHFDIPEESAFELHRGLQSQLPGYLVPRLSREEPGKESKTILL